MIVEDPMLYTCVALPTKCFLTYVQIDNWNQLYLSIFPIGYKRVFAAVG